MPLCGIGRWNNIARHFLFLSLCEVKSCVHHSPPVLNFVSFFFFSLGLGRAVVPRVPPSQSNPVGIFPMICTDSTEHSTKSIWTVQTTLRRPLSGSRSVLRCPCFCRISHQVPPIVHCGVWQEHFTRQSASYSTVICRISNVDKPYEVSSKSSKSQDLSNNNGRYRTSIVASVLARLRNFGTV